MRIEPSKKICSTFSSLARRFEKKSKIENELFALQQVEKDTNTKALSKEELARKAEIEQELSELKYNSRDTKITPNINRQDFINGEVSKVSLGQSVDENNQQLKDLRDPQKIKETVQKRSLDKITFPDHWANTCCSHPLHIEDETNGIEGVKNAARRKLEQELGIKPNQIPLDSLTFITRIHYKAICMDDIWGEHEIDYILICKPPQNVFLNINPNEVSQAKYFCQEELKQFMKIKN